MILVFKYVTVMVLGAALLTAQSRRPTKPFTPPEDYYTSQPVVAKDEGCAKDYLKALTLSGLEQRKMLADLISYQCVEVMQFRYRALILEGKTLDVGSQHFPMVRVNLATNLGVVPIGPAVVKTGWMLNSALVKRSQIERRTSRRQDKK